MAVRVVLGLVAGLVIGAGGMYAAYNWPFGVNETKRVEDRVLAKFASEPSEFSPKLVPTTARCGHRVAKVYDCNVAYEDGTRQSVTVSTEGGSVRVIGSQ